MIPALKDMHIIRTFAGLRPYTPDGLPILGKIDALDGFFIAAGHEGDGIALSAVTGELLSDLIVDNRETIPLNDYRLERFH
jgi:sarcosine oxidase subunit beta